MASETPISNLAADLLAEAEHRRGAIVDLLRRAAAVIGQQQRLAATADEPLHITHRPLIRNAISLLRIRRPVSTDVERVAAGLESMLEGQPTPAGKPGADWLAAAVAVPDGATHYYPKAPADRQYRKQVDGIWCEFCGGNWLPLDHDMAHEYVAIAGMEQVEKAIVQHRRAIPAAAPVMDTFKSKSSSIDSHLKVSTDAPYGVFFEVVGGSQYVNLSDEDAIKLRDWLSRVYPNFDRQQEG